MVERLHIQAELQPIIDGFHEGALELKDGDNFEGHESFNASNETVLAAAQLNRVSAGEESCIDLLLTLPHKGQLQISASWVSDPLKVRKSIEIKSQGIVNIQGKICILGHWKMCQSLCKARHHRHLRRYQVHISHFHVHNGQQFFRL